jgi:hypothetical protein
MRLTFALLAGPLIFGGGYAVAQGGGLAGVTMRVVDDLRDVDAVVLELEAAAAKNTDDAGDAERPHTDAREPEDASDDASRREEEGAERPVPEQPPA